MDVSKKTVEYEHIVDIYVSTIVSVLVTITGEVADIELQVDQ